MPSTPPTEQIITLSTTNCMRMLPLVAPMALRVPISRVRSVTETSMMFITPMPPTSSEIAAIAAMAMLTVPIMESTVERMLSMLIAATW